MTDRFDLETTTLGELLDDPDARAIIVELVPELPDHPMIGFAKGMPAAAVLKMAGGQVPPAVLDQLRPVSRPFDDTRPAAGRAHLRSTVRSNRVTPIRHSACG